MGEPARRRCRLNPELRGNHNAVATVPCEASQFSLRRSQSIHARHIEVRDALIEGFGEQTLALACRWLAHQTRTAEADPRARDARGQRGAFHASKQSTRDDCDRARTAYPASRMEDLIARISLYTDPQNRRLGTMRRPALVGTSILIAVGVLKAQGRLRSVEKTG